MCRYLFVCLPFGLVPTLVHFRNAIIALPGNIQIVIYVAPVGTAIIGLSWRIWHYHLRVSSVKAAVSFPFIRDLLNYLSRMGGIAIGS